MIGRMTRVVARAVLVALLAANGLAALAQPAAGPDAAVPARGAGTEELAPPVAAAPAGLPEEIRAERAVAATVEPTPLSDVAPDPEDMLDVLRERWRGAVAAGETDLGFGPWLGVMTGLGDGSVPEADTQAARTRAASGDWQNRVGPVRLGEAGRVVTVYGASIPTAFCAPLTVCYIELEAGEVLTDTPSFGDAARWQMAVKVQGHDPETVVLEVKPAEDATHTNVVIPTDRRLYTIALVNDPEVHTPILSFTYPDSEARRIADGIEARRAAEAAVAALAAETRAKATSARGIATEDGLALAEELDFGFRVSGQAPFGPVRVYSDGRKTYIDLHPRYRGPVPALLGGPDESNAVLNIRVTEDGRRMVADRVIQDIWLAHGRQRVRIRRAGQ